MKIQFVLLVCLVALVAGKPAAECPKKDEGGPYFVQDDELCGIFYECSGGTPIQLTCPGTTYWDQAKSMCEVDVDCEGRKTTTAVPPTDPTAVPTAVPTAIPTTATPEDA